MIPDRGGSFGYKLLHLIIDLLQNSARLEVTNENPGCGCGRAEPRSWWRWATTATTLPQPYHDSCNLKFCSFKGSHQSFVFSSFPTFVSFHLQ
jgi:hypothetical protein